jgi:hypothetical protein
MGFNNRDFENQLGDGLACFLLSRSFQFFESGFFEAIQSVIRFSIILYFTNSKALLHFQKLMQRDWIRQSF